LFEKVEKLFKDSEDVCEELEISSASELLRVLAKLGLPRFLEILEQVRTTRKMKSPSPTE